MGTRRQPASDSQIANPLVESSLLLEVAELVPDTDPCNCYQTRFVLSLGRPESMVAA